VGAVATGLVRSSATSPAENPPAGPRAVDLCWRFSNALAYARASEWRVAVTLKGEWGCRPFPVMQSPSPRPTATPLLKHERLP